MRIVVGVVLVALGASVSAEPAAAQRNPATVYRGPAFYRALLLTRPPAYWMGGTVWTPLAPYVYPPLPALARPAPRVLARPQPVTKRVPDEYLAAALAAQHDGPLWVKTARGFRLDQETAR